MTSDAPVTHTLKCSNCGNTVKTENCTYTFSGNLGTCEVCEDALTVEIDPAPLTYDGTEKEPGVTVKRGDDALETGYAVTYANNKNAGTNTASVTVTIGSNQGTYTEKFKISPAIPTIAWGADAQTQTVTYTGQPADITPPTVTLVNGEATQRND